MRKILENGFLEIDDCPLAKSGVFMYHSSELGMEGDKMVSVRIPEDVLGKTSFDFDLPITLGHTWLGLNAKKNKRAEIIGQSTNAHQDFDMIRGRVVLYDKDVIKGIMDGSMVDELSPAFRFRIVEDEEKIADFVAVEVYAPNHIALVSKGRMGKDVRVIHEAIQEEMKQEADIADKEQEQQPDDKILQDPPLHQADQEKGEENGNNQENNTDVSEEKEADNSGTNTENVRPDESSESIDSEEKASEPEQKTDEQPSETKPDEETKADEKPAETEKQPSEEEVKAIPQEAKQEEEKKEPEKPIVKHFSYNGVRYSIMGSNGKPPLPHNENSAKIRY